MPASDDADATAAMLDGRYRLIESLGVGGSAQVHRAEDTQLGRIVAIKMLRPDRDTLSAPERAQVETAVLASLNHPSLVTLYDAQLEPGRPQYLVMEYVEGPTLSARLRQGPLSGGDAAVLAHDLAEALSVVHGRGIVHRDVKPSNVLLAPPVRRDRPWAAKLADFGIAHVLEDPRVTSPGLVIGTATYMAPEQVSKGELTPAADVYSLGLVLLETLTGAPAYRGSTAVETALARLSSPLVIPASVGPEWAALLTRMTATDAAERPTADEVAVAAAALAEAQLSETQPAGVATAAIAAETAAMTTPLPEHPTGPTRVLPAAAPVVAPATTPMSKRAIALAAAVLLIAAAGIGAWAVGAAQGDAQTRLTHVLRTHEPVPAATPDPVVSDGGGDEAGNSGNSGSGNSGKGDENKDKNNGKGGSNGKGNGKG